MEVLAASFASCELVLGLAFGQQTEWSWFCLFLIGLGSSACSWLRVILAVRALVSFLLHTKEF